MCVPQAFVCMQKCAYVPTCFSVHITNLQQTCRCSVPTPRCLATVSSTRVCLESVKINRESSSQRTTSLWYVTAEKWYSVLCFQSVRHVLLSFLDSSCSVPGSEYLTKWFEEKVLILHLQSVKKFWKTNGIFFYSLKKNKVLFTHNLEFGWKLHF